MNKTKIAKTLMAAMIGSALIGGSALADESLSQKASQTADSTGAKIDSSMKKVDGFMDVTTAPFRSAIPSPRVKT